MLFLRARIPASPCRRKTPRGFRWRPAPEQREGIRCGKPCLAPRPPSANHVESEAAHERAFSPARRRWQAHLRLPPTRVDITAPRLRPDCGMQAAAKKLVRATSFRAMRFRVRSIDLPSGRDFSPIDLCAAALRSCPLLRASKDTGCCVAFAIAPASLHLQIQGTSDLPSVNYSDIRGAFGLRAGTRTVRQFIERRGGPMEKADSNQGPGGCATARSRQSVESRYVIAAPNRKTEPWFR